MWPGRREKRKRKRKRKKNTYSQIDVELAGVGDVGKVTSLLHL